MAYDASRVFSEGLITVTLKAPPDFRSFQKVLPQSAFDQHSQRRLFDVQYGYRSKSIEEMAEFELQASFVRLAAPLSATDLDADTLYRESYGTLIDSKTLFFVTGSYWENIRKDPAWFGSRRALLRSILDHVAVRAQ